MEETYTNLQRTLQGLLILQPLRSRYRDLDDILVTVSREATAALLAHTEEAGPASDLEKGVHESLMRLQAKQA